MTDANYSEAVKLLDIRFGNKDRIVAKHMDVLLNLESVPYSGYISSEFNFVLFVLILFERIYSERKFNVGVTASSGHVV